MDNEVYLRGVLRIYRNAIVEFVRSRMNATLGDQAIAELSKLFGKEENGKTRWENLKLNAARARATPEVSTAVTDEFELLGVADFYSVCEKFYPQLFPESAELDEAITKEHRAGLLRCMRQIKVMRDPTSHEVTQDIGNDELNLTASNVVIVLKACGKHAAADQVRRTLLEISTAKPSFTVCVAAELGGDIESVNALASKLSALGISVSVKQLSFNAAGEGDTTVLPACTNIAPVFRRIPEPDSPAAQALRGIGGKCNVIAVHEVALDQAEWTKFAGHMGIVSTARISLPPEYVAEAADKLLRRLQPERSAKSRPELSAAVPVAKAVSDGAIVNRLYDQLRHPELKAVSIVTPFASDVAAWSLQSTTLAKLLAEQKKRGASVTFITRPPTPSEGYEQKKQFLATLIRSGVKVLLHEALHAKIFLFESSAGRLRWFVGSHNLTTNALTKLKEVSMEGFREPEYREAETAMIKIREDRRIQTFELWNAQEARQGAPR